MNRGQRIAVIVGSVAVVAFVLFPVWTDQHGQGHVRLRWISSEPVIIEEVEERIVYYDDGVNKFATMMGRTETEPVLRHATRVRRVQSRYAISPGWSALAITAALALIAVAVLLLRTRSPQR